MEPYILAFLIGILVIWLAFQAYQGVRRLVRGTSRGGGWFGATAFDGDDDRDGGDWGGGDDSDGGSWSD